MSNCALRYSICFKTYLRRNYMSTCGFRNQMTVVTCSSQQHPSFYDKFYFSLFVFPLRFRCHCNKSTVCIKKKKNTLRFMCHEFRFQSLASCGESFFFFNRKQKKIFGNLRSYDSCGNENFNLK